MNSKLFESCPCQMQGGSNYSSCCRPYHQNLEKPETAEQLMRSRYSAYVLGLIDYLIQSTLPAQQNLIDRAVLKGWLEKSQWLNLNIIDISKGQASDSSGIVKFTAQYKYQEKINQHKETSQFQKENDTWFFVYNKKDLDIKKARTGRNDPCPCGSGKKFKKCCSI